MLNRQRFGEGHNAGFTPLSPKNEGGGRGRGKGQHRIGAVRNSRENRWYSARRRDLKYEWVNGFGFESGHGSGCGEDPGGCSPDGRGNG